MSNVPVFQVECREINLDLNEHNPDWNVLGKSAKVNNIMSQMKHTQSSGFNRNIFHLDEMDEVKSLANDELKNTGKCSLASGLLSPEAASPFGFGANGSFDSRNTDLSGFMGDVLVDNLNDGDLRDYSNRDSISPTRQIIDKDFQKSKKKIPGPAGTLPKLKDGQGIDENVIKELIGNTTKPKRNHKNSLSVELSQGTQVASEHPFRSTAWSHCMSDLENAAPCLFDVLDRYSFASVPKRVKMKALPSCKVPVICAAVESITLHNIDASVVLKDPSGSMPGALHREIVKEYGDRIYVGSVLILKQVGVFSPAFGRNCYLNITPNNLVRIYSKSTSLDSNSVVKVQDPDFSELVVFSRSIIKQSSSECFASNNTSSNSSNLRSNTSPRKSVQGNLSARENYGSTESNSLLTNKQKTMPSVCRPTVPDSQSSWSLGDVDNSQGLLDDWFDDDEMDVLMMEQEHGISSSNTSKLSRNDLNSRIEPTSCCEDNHVKGSKTKPSNIFCVGPADDFQLLDAPLETRKNPPVSSEKSLITGDIVSGSCNKRSRLLENFPEPSKRTKFVPPLDEKQVVSGRGNNHPVATKISPNPTLNCTPQQNQPGTTFKFRKVPQSVSSCLSSQNIFSQSQRSTQDLPHVNTIPDNLTANVQMSKEQPNKVQDHETFSTLFDGLDDELLDDF